MVVRQWHFASATCNWLYEKGFLTRLLENGRHEVRRFEDLIYGFYRKYPRRFLPVCLFEVLYHALGITEVWYILSRISDANPSLLTAATPFICISLPSQIFSPARASSLSTIGLSSVCVA